LQERRVGQHTLPDDVFIVAAGNTVDDGAVAYEMGSALSDRLIHLQVTASPRDWLEHYAVARGIHPSVTAFLRARPDLLDTTEDMLRQGQMISCTPRSWERVSDIVRAVPDKRLREVMIAGTLGTSPAAEFARVADELDAMVTIDELIASPRGQRAALYPVTMNGLVGLIYAVVARVDGAAMPALIEIMADIRTLDRDGALPLSELTSFGFELLIRKALAEGLEESFRGSEAYAAYLRSREGAV
jgi:hypothetical protein